MTQLALEIISCYLVETPLPAAADSKRAAKDLACFALAKKTARTTALLGRAAIAYAKYADLAARVWRDTTRMLEEERAGISALRWRQIYERTVPSATLPTRR